LTPFRHGVSGLEARSKDGRTVTLRNRRQRPAAILVGLLLLVAQLVVAGHAHARHFGTTVSATSTASTDVAGQCAICLSALHGSAVVSTPPAFVSPARIAGATVDLAIGAYGSPVRSALHGRAPPALI